MNARESFLDAVSGEVNDAMEEWDNRISVTAGSSMAGYITERLEKVGALRTARTITNEDESDALPVGSIVLDCNGDTARKFRGGWRTTVTEPDGTAWLSGHMEDADLPATVLHEPEAAS